MNTLGWFLSNLAVGTVASVVASLIFHRALQLKDKRFCEKQYGVLAGAYGLYNVSGESQNCVVTIEYQAGNILTTRCEAQQWTGTLWLSRECPDYGKGVYRFNTREDCGLHEIQVNRADRSINVLVVNTSHGKNEMWSLVWRRIEREQPHKLTEPAIA